jgi:hypothetical protein
VESQPLSNPSRPGEHAGAQARTITNVFFVLFCIEIGLVLFLLPWTLLCVVNLWIGLIEAWRLWH